MIVPSTIIDPDVGGFSKVFFLKGDRAAIIDTGIAGTEQKILYALDSAGIARDNVSLIVITHAHADHTGSLKKLRETLGVSVMAGWPDAGYLEKGENAPIVPVSLMGRGFHLFTKGQKSDINKPDIVIKEDISLLEYGIDARILVTPGHTMGSLSVLADDGRCAIGDLLGKVYASKTPGLSPFAERSELIGPSLKKVLDAGAKYLYPSHGSMWDAAAVRAKFPKLLS